MRTYDARGRLLTIGDMVLIPYRNTIKVCEVTGTEPDGNSVLVLPLRETSELLIVAITAYKLAEE